jgi:ATP-dependent Clp protease, protease subunit
LYKGQAGECMLEANKLLKMRKTMSNIYAQRTSKLSWQIYKDTERDLYMSAEEAQARGIIDTVANSL